MLEFTIYTGNCTGNSANCLYPNKCVIKDKASFLEAIKRDHVTAKFKENYRSVDNFQMSDNVPLDCDNDHTENEMDWVTPLDVALAMPGVSFVAAFSRNHMKQKGAKSPRPRFHVFFPIPPMTSGGEYSALKRRIASFFPYFDSNALDCARFFFGSQDAEVEIYEGKTNIVDFLQADVFTEFDVALEKGTEEKTNIIDSLEANGFEEFDAFAEFDRAQDAVPEGKRNSTMSHIAGRLIKRYGNSSDSYALFLKEAEKCEPPLPDNELKVIWSSAVKFGKKVSSQEGYIPPEEYNSDYQLKPEDYSDVGQATILAREYEGVLRFSPSTDYLVYNNRFWEESKAKSQGVSQDLTERQLKEAEATMKKAMEELMENGGMDILTKVGAKKAVHMFNKQQSHSFDKYEGALEYKKFAIKRRDSKYIAATLKEAIPMLEIDQSILDGDEFLLNTPSCTYDLRRGLASPLKHNPQHFITKETLVNPSLEGCDIWESALNTFFQNDKELISYVQRMVGLSAIGKVYVEALIIAYGEGRNGKSTFWNVIARVLGSYSGNISADMLTVGCRRNVKPELAEAKGKRMLIAAELEEGMRLNTANVKQLCSTDEIYAEKKYKDPFSYVPTHTLVLYTNHLPKVGAIDKGTWRRLIVIPFDAKIEGSSDIKNYADYLVEQAGGAVLSWVIEGARMVIEENYKIDPPKRVREAIEQYKENNDWLSYFLLERCEVDETFVAKSGEVYNEYRMFCSQVGEFTRSTADFYTALESADFKRVRSAKGRQIKGLRLKSEFLQED